jgi:hypothetical protein
LAKHDSLAIRLYSVGKDTIEASQGTEGGEGMARTAVGGFSGDDFRKMLAVVSLLIGVGVLPQKWQKTASAASLALLILKWM